jgi:maleylacetate reductase
MAARRRDLATDVYRVSGLTAAVLMSALGPGSFVYNAQAAKVIFGLGTLTRLGAELAQIGASRALVLSTHEQRALADHAVAAASGRAAGSFAAARMHTPAEVTEQALVVLHDLKADALVSVGGGSATGLGKALALRSGLPQVAVPTTYAGSEMTPILGETKDGRKVTQRNESLLPRAVIYDVELTFSLPVNLSVTSGINAIAHAAEALYARDGNPITSLMAEEGVRALAAALPAIQVNPKNAAARASALYGAWLCGVCLGTVGMALHHKLCHVLGGSFDLPHSETHAVILPYAIAFNTRAAPDAMRKLARALGAKNAADGLWDLNRRLHAPASLAAIGMPEAGVARATELAVQNPYWNPQPLDKGALLNLLERAYAGVPPRQAVQAA